MPKYLMLFIFGLICLSFYFLPAPVPVQSAGEPTSLNNVTLWIYPEYDDPRLLVMVEGRIAGVSAPTQIRFLVPSSAEMYSAGSKDAQGNYSGGPPDRKASQIQGWDEISYTLKTDIFRVEYYDPIISGQQNKSISYDFRTLYPISTLKVVVQIPLKATDFSALPAGVKSTEGNFAVYSYFYTNQTTDKPLHYDISYTKTDTNPSLGTNTNSPAQGGSSNLVPISIIAGSVIIVFGVVWALKSTKKKSAAKIPKTHHEQVKLHNKFCNQCGKRLEYPSKYCPYCKQKLEE
jgi:hypothetical protein